MQHRLSEIETCNLSQWELARRLNQRTGVTPAACQYVVLINQTYSFQIENDLKKTLRINKKPLNWFIRKFQQYRVRVEFTTLFTKKELDRFGPIAIQQSHGIVTRLFNQRYNPTTVKLVTPTWFAKKMWNQQCPFTLIHPDEFRDTICV